MKVFKPYHGVVVPLVTALNQNFSIDLESHGRILERIIQSRAIPFVLGTTGEYASLSGFQKELLVKATVSLAGGRTLVFAGISGNCLEESVADAEKYAGFGVDVLVAHVPCYYPLDDKQTFQFFNNLADRCPKPLIIYNIPLTTHYSIPVEVIEKLSCHPNIAGIKDSEPDAARTENSLRLWKDRSDFSFFAGSSSLSVFSMKAGADGIVPGTGNLFPDWYVEMVEALQNGKVGRADELQHLTNQVTWLFQKEGSLNRSLPALKIMLSEMGLCQPWVMPPLCRMEAHTESKFRQEVMIRLKDIMDRKKALQE